MNVVKDLQSLIQLMHSHNEVIVFPIGGEGQQLLDFLRYANFLERVCCIAATEVVSGVEQKFIHEVPVIPFENLVHFRETALLIVSAPEQFHENIDAELTRFGFKTVVFVRNDIHAQIINELQKMYSTGQIMMWYMRHFDEKITKLENGVAEHNEVTAFNTKAFAEFRNAFRGKDIVIVGSGPTSKYYPPIRDAIHIGLNLSWRREGIPIDYLFTIDGYRNLIDDAKVEDGFHRIHRRVFVGKIVDRCSENCGNYYESIYLHGPSIVRFFVNDCNLDQTIHQDICYHPLADFWSVSFEALHFSLLTYPKRIFLVGCDTSPTGHFYAESDKIGDIFKRTISVTSKFMKVGYARMKMFAKHHYPDTEIISINPVGLRGLFKDVYKDEYKASLAENSSMTPSFSGGGYRIRDDPYSTFAEKFVA